MAASSGGATPAATAAWATRQPTANFYRAGWDGLSVASLGLGSYLGEADAATDAGYMAAAERYLALGGNLIDTASNYRFQRSERALGQALQAAFAGGQVSRAEVVVCSKGGYLPYDGDWPADPEAWIRETLIEPGVVEPEAIVDGHSLAPTFLRHQLAQSLRNLQLERLDLYYLHNPETQRAALGEAAFRERLGEAFATLEVAVAQGQVGAYGLATWNGFRVPPEAGEYLSLAAMVALARDVAGDRHHFRAVQLPLNFQLLEALGRNNQPDPAGTGQVSLLAAAAELGISVIASAPMFQARLLGRLPETLRAAFPDGLSDAQRALQFVRSVPGVTAALAGMSQPAHVDENLALRQLAPMSVAAIQALFGRQGTA